MGVRFWNNSKQPHVVSNYVGYRNGTAGIENGAYSNSNRYADVLLVEERLIHHTSGTILATDGGPGRYERLEIRAPVGMPAIEVRGLNLPAATRQEFIDCVLVPGAGAPKVRIVAGGNPLIALFRNCGITPADIEWPNPIPEGLEGSDIIIEHEDGRRWQVQVAAGLLQITETPVNPF
jgi:hypothetical protein